MKKNSSLIFIFQENFSAKQKKQPTLAGCFPFIYYLFFLINFS